MIYICFMVVKHAYKIILISVIMLAFLSCKKSEVISYDLIKNWKFKKDTSKKWLLASVPGCAQTDLLYHGIIEDPYVGNNEKELQWIGESDWDYNTTFNAQDFLNFQHVELVFEGLDTYADIYLNDSLILNADNMFRKWEVQVKHLLKAENNSLFVRLKAPGKIEEEKASSLNYSLPDDRGLTRKAPYQYGWDWGPTFVTSGIWKPLYIRAWNDVRITDVHVFTTEISGESATVNLMAEIMSSHEQRASMSWQIGDHHFSKEVSLGMGLNTFKESVILADPKLWWPNGMGGHPLYDLSYQIETQKSKDESKERFGIRQIELIQEKDSIGQSFYFKINGRPFFAKGANYIPQDNFIARVTDEKYMQTIKTAVDANMNMLRVWGGGIYEKDIFYNLCDENGILVWQDFMFACNMYPGDAAFIENVKQEASYQVKRLRNHPCLALWCGNNEVDEGWKNWGWQKALDYSPEDSTEIWNNYLKIFEEVLPQTIFDYSPYLPYIPSSPKIGWGHNEALTEGDMHYWGVWWGEEPFDIYEEKVGRFMSEYGFQGFPDRRTLDSCLYPEDLSLNSASLLNHQKHPRGMELIQSYMEREYKVPANFNDYAYVTQLVQAYGIRKAIEAHRRAMPYCMGTLYWQLNDCWPVISWSSVDYYNRWKALHYFVRESYSDLIISIERKNNEVNVYIVSDLTGLFNANLVIELIDFHGKSHWQKIIPVSVKGNSSSIYFTFDLDEINHLSLDNLVLNSKLISDSNMVWTEKNYFFNLSKNLRLGEPNITYKTSQDQYGHYIRIKTENLAKNIFLSLDENGHFTDNYFDLLPNDSVVIQFISEHDDLTNVKPIDNFEKRLRIISLIDTF